MVRMICMTVFSYRNAMRGVCIKTSNRPSNYTPVSSHGPWLSGCVGIELAICLCGVAVTEADACVRG